MLWKGSYRRAKGVPCGRASCNTEVRARSIHLEEKGLALAHALRASEPVLHEEHCRSVRMYGWWW